MATLHAYASFNLDTDVKELLWQLCTRWDPGGTGWVFLYDRMLVLLSIYTSVPMPTSEIMLRRLRDRSISI
jgi:hypothetical protein